MKYQSGQKVRCIDVGKTYSTYDVMAKMMKAAKWTSGNTPKKGEVYTVVSSHAHEHEARCIIYLIEKDEKQYLVGNEGLMLVEEKKTESKVGDKVKLKDYKVYGDWRQHDGQIGKITEDYGVNNGSYRFGITWSDGENSSSPESNLVMVKETPKFTTSFYVNCPTEEIWNKVVEKGISMGYKNVGGRKTFKDGWKIVDLCVEDGEPAYMFLWNDFRSVLTSKKTDYRDFLGTEMEDRKEEWHCYHGLGGGINELPNTWRMFEPGLGGWVDIGDSPITSFIKRTMGVLRDIPNRLKRALNANLRKFYQLEWINGNLEITGEGEAALTNFLFDKFEKELGEVAAQKIKELKKSKKEEVEE